MCDDECPTCGASDHCPIESEDISAFFEKDSRGIHRVYYSPPGAGHHPEYELMASTHIPSLAGLLLSIAFEASKPR